MKALHVISGGAAQGLVAQLSDSFSAAHGLKPDGTFGAVGLMKDKLLAGAPCDVIILTAALIAELEQQGHVQPGSARPLGVVRTGVAVKAGEPMPDVATPDALKALLRSAKGIYFPDPVKATAGIHFMKVLKALGVDQELAERLRPFPNGATAMREMAAAPGTGLVGCTQVTEILYTPGVTLVGVLPPEFELATVYTAAVCSRAANPAAAQALVELLSAPANARQRLAGGFEER
ncbi:molybdate ABC transporter substrate-binding protein [Caenimonas terrae]|uniref:Molybdate ABC transporter substrate-binding protein n=1 Tax=Caenimonas terrae TaxID=696074 RepID=A0ABW0N882_9BURK